MRFVDYRSQEHFTSRIERAVLVEAAMAVEQ